jgi:hypothetical protein
MAPLKYFLFFLLTIGLAGCSSEKARRLKWNLKTTVREYEEVGRHHDPKWDADAKEALTLFAEWRAGDAMDTALVEKIGRAAQKASDAGCPDPLIAYLRARFVVNKTSRSGKDIADAHRYAANGLKESYYSSLRRFYGALRAGETLYKLNPKAKLDCTILMNDAARALVEVIEEDDAPHKEIFLAARAFCWSFSKMEINTDRGWYALEPLLRKKWGNKYRETLAISEPLID